MQNRFRRVEDLAPQSRQAIEDMLGRTLATRCGTDRGVESRLRYQCAGPPDRHSRGFESDC